MFIKNFTHFTYSSYDSASSLVSAGNEYSFLGNFQGLYPLLMESLLLNSKCTQERDFVLETVKNVSVTHIRLEWPVATSNKIELELLDWVLRCLGERQVCKYFK